MLSRERMRLSLEHREPDRVPIDIGGIDSAIEIPAYVELKKYLGIESETSAFVRLHANLDQEIMDRFGVDTKYIRPQKNGRWETTTRGDVRYIDIWGVPWLKPHDGIYYDLEKCPLKEATIEDIEQWDPPELLSVEMINEMKITAKELYDTTPYALLSDIIGAGIFERTWYLRGFNEVMMDLVLNPIFMEKFLDKILETEIKAYELLLDAISPYIEGVFITEDLGMQEGLLISADTYRKFLKPRHKILFDTIHKYGVRVIFHSCGSIYDLLPELIDVGIDVLNPVQVNAKNMDSKILKREFGKDLVFWGGGCDTQEILARGTPVEVENEVRRRLEDLMPGGGFIFTPVHCIQPGTPPENICRMYDTVLKYGIYT